MAKDKNQWGLAASTARELLAKANGKQVMVREKPIDGSWHASRAVLVSVLNERTARVKPLQGHKKTEDVPLSTLKLWKSACTLNGVDTSMSSAVAEPPVSKKVSAQNFVVISRSNGGVWAGENLQWNSNPLRGIAYEEANAKRACFALSRKDDSKDCQVVPLEEAMQILGEMRGPVTLPPPIESPKPRSASRMIPISQISQMAFDIDAILNEDDSLLAAARSRRKAAAQEVKDAQQMLAEAMQKLQEAQTHYENVMGRVQPGRVQEDQAQESGQREKRSYTKRGALKATVQKVLSQSSHLSPDAIIEKVMGMIDLKAENPESSIKQCLYSMSSAKEVSKNDQGAYALTPFGRQRMQDTSSANNN